MHTCIFSGQLNTLIHLIQEFGFDQFSTFNISDGGTFNFNELICWRFDGWLWCAEV